MEENLETGQKADLETGLEEDLEAHLGANADPGVEGHTGRMRVGEFF